MSDPVLNDLLVASGTGNEFNSIPIGANGKVLRADSGAPGYGDIPKSTVIDLETELDDLCAFSSTMWVNGFDISINADPTKVDITAGEGYSSDYWTNPGIPVDCDPVAIGAKTVTVDNILTNQITWMAITVDGTVLQNHVAMNGPFNQRIIVAEWLVIHQFGEVTSFSTHHPAGLSLGSTVGDMLDTYGLKATGIIYSPGTTGTTGINRGAGTYFFRSINLLPPLTEAKRRDPNNLPVDLDENTAWVETYGDVATGFTFVGPKTVVTSNTYWNRTTHLLDTASVNDWTARLILLASDGLTTVIVLGNETYNSFDAALAGIFSEVKELSPNINPTTLRGVMFLRGASGTGDTRDIADCVFKRVNNAGVFPII